MTDGQAGGLRVSEVVVDCADHGRVVDFWAAALGYRRHEVNEQVVTQAVGGGDGPGGPRPPCPLDRESPGVRPARPAAE